MQRKIENPPEVKDKSSQGYKNLSLHREKRDGGLTGIQEVETDKQQALLSEGFIVRIPGRGLWLSTPDKCFQKSQDHSPATRYHI